MKVLPISTTALSMQNVSKVQNSAKAVSFSAQESVKKSEFKTIPGEKGQVLNYKDEKGLHIKAGTTISISNGQSNIWSVTGTYSGLNTADATATAADIVKDETAYVNGSKITGTLVINKYYMDSGAPASSLGSDGDIYLQS